MLLHIFLKPVCEPSCMPESLGEVQGVPLVLISPGEARTHPVWVDSELRSTPYEARGKHGYTAARRFHLHDDIYANETLLTEAVARLGSAKTWSDHLAFVKIGKNPHVSAALRACARTSKAALPSSWTVSGADLAHRLFMNEHDTPVILRWFSCNEWSFVIPPNAGFLLTDLLTPHPRGWESVLARIPTADLILMDPFWPNRSARRAWHGNSAHSYHTMRDVYDLWRLRPTIESLLARHTLVGIWVTNHVRRRANAAENSRIRVQEMVSRLWVKAPCDLGMVEVDGAERQCAANAHPTWRLVIPTAVRAASHRLAGGIKLYSTALHSYEHAAWAQLQAIRV